MTNSTQKTNTIQHLLDLFDLQTRLFNNVVQGISDTLSISRISEHNNHVAWLTGHTVSTRYMLANALGMQLNEPFPDLFANGKGLQQDVTYPSMDALTANWSEISDTLHHAWPICQKKPLPTNYLNPFPQETPLAILSALLFTMKRIPLDKLVCTANFWALMP